MLSWNVADQYVEFIDKEDIDMFADRNRIVLVHWFASVHISYGYQLLSVVVYLL